jgi:predicted transposase YbfD/YdcC
VCAFQPLLDGLDSAGTIVTADALQTHPEAAEFLVARKQAHDLLVVNANQPTCWPAASACPGTACPWPTAPVTRRTAASSSAPSRPSTSTISGSPRRPGPPGHPQDPRPARITRRWQTVTVYAVTGLPFEQASPARLADLLRGHGAIEALRHIRDVTFCEDASQLRTAAGPSVMACLPNLVIGCCAGRGRSTSPPSYAAMPATHANPRHPRDQIRVKPTSQQNDGGGAGGFRLTVSNPWGSRPTT